MELKQRSAYFSIRHEIWIAAEWDLSVCTEGAKHFTACVSGMDMYSHLLRGIGRADRQVWDMVEKQAKSEKSENLMADPRREEH